MAKNKSRLDIVQLVLEDCLLAYPVSSFIISLYQQYQQRGSLSKKQLQGLYLKAKKCAGISPGKLAGLEVIINKMTTRDKTLPPRQAPIVTEDETIRDLLHALLEKYPQHKRVLFLKAKFDHRETISTSEKAELIKFQKLLLGK